MADVDGAPPGEPGLPGPGQENQDPTDKGSLRKMFAEGIAEIETHRFLRPRTIAVVATSAGGSGPPPSALPARARRSENLFQALEQRSLTDEEQRVIEQRVCHLASPAVQLGLAMRLRFRSRAPACAPPVAGGAPAQNAGRVREA